MYIIYDQTNIFIFVAIITKYLTLCLLTFQVSVHQDKSSVLNSLKVSRIKSYLKMPAGKTVIV